MAHQQQRGTTAIRQWCLFAVVCHFSEPGRARPPRSQALGSIGEVELIVISEALLIKSVDYVLVKKSERI